MLKLENAKDTFEILAMNQQYVLVKTSNNSIHVLNRKTLNKIKTIKTV